jgi:hypothetical protein
MRAFHRMGLSYPSPSPSPPPPTGGGGAGGGAFARLPNWPTCRSVVHWSTGLFLGENCSFSASGPVDRLRGVLNCLSPKAFFAEGARRTVELFIIITSFERSAPGVCQALLGGGCDDPLWPYGQHPSLAAGACGSGCSHHPDSSPPWRHAVGGNRLRYDSSGSGLGNKPP